MERRVDLLPGEQARALRPGEEDAFLQVLCAAFGLNADAARPLFRADPFFDLSHKRALWTADGQIASVLTVIPCFLRVGGSMVPVGGIAGVATRLDRRGQGCASRLLRATVSACDTELPYSALALFAVQREFYRRLGWADVSRLWTWQAEPEEKFSAHSQNGGNERKYALSPFLLQATHTSGDAERAAGQGTGSARSALHALHGRLTEGRTGACERDSRRWHIIDTLAPARQTWVFGDTQGCPQGYALLDRLDEPGDAYRVVELLADGDEARSAARAFLETPPFPVSRWEWSACPADFAALSLSTENLAPEPGMMLTLCAPARALSLRHADGFRRFLTRERSLTLRLDEKTFLLNERGVHVGQGGPDFISCDSRTLAQIFMGYHGAGEAARLGLLTASSSDALALAERLFPSLHPCVLPADQF